VDGLKWISSFPENVAAGLPRGLGRAHPQRPRHRLPVRLPGKLDHQRHQDRRVGGARGGLAYPRPAPACPGGVLGTGLIARYIHTFLAGNGWSFDEIGVHDLSADSAAGFRGYLEKAGPGRITVYEDAEQLIRSSDLVVFATIAGEPHVSELSWFGHNPVVLHVSLRDSRRRSCSPRRTWSTKRRALPEGQYVARTWPSS